MKRLVQRFHNAWTWWLSTARHPVFATCANALGVFAGLLGALYTDDIRGAFPFYWGPYAGFSAHAVIFWTSFVVFTLTFLSREWSIDKQRIFSQQQLEETIRTMPPRGFIVEFANYYAQCHKVVRALDSFTAVNEDGVRQAIRIILSCIAQLARKFDAAQQYTYAANIMQYWESAQAWQVATGSVAMPDVKFAEVEAAVDRLPLLILDQTLSTTTELENLNFSPDPALEKMKHMALPIPTKGHAGKSDDGRRWRVLPGAPLAFFTETSISYAHANELGKWCRERGDFSESVALQLDAHFGQAHLQSFASIPIKSSVSAKPFRVVNLHSTGPGMLSGAGVPSQFFPLMEPFINLLADSLTRLSEIRQAR